MKNLIHGQVIRVAGFPQLNKVEVSTLPGYVADNNAKYAKQFHETVETHLRLDRKFGRDTKWAWASQEPGMLTADYPGKHEKLAAERASIAAAVQVEHGETVEIMGFRFLVKVMGNYSDPVHFIHLP